MKCVAIVGGSLNNQDLIMKRDGVLIVVDFKKNASRHGYLQTQTTSNIISLEDFLLEKQSSKSMQRQDQFVQSVVDRWLGLNGQRLSVGVVRNVGEYLEDTSISIEKEACPKPKH